MVVTMVRLLPTTHVNAVSRSTAMDARDAGAPGARSVKASEFKAKCLNLMNEVAESGAE